MLLVYDKRTKFKFLVQKRNSAMTQIYSALKGPKITP